MQPLFEICLIARNESKTLPRLVESLKEFAERGGKIHLLDTGSTDNTAQIARNFGIDVHEVGDKFKIKIDEKLAKEINERFIENNEANVVNAGDSMFDFASARNYIAEFANTDVIATPDCDEIYTKFDIDKINEAIKNGAEQLEYNFVFSHDDQGNPVIKFLHSKFYNRKKLKWEGIIHEVLVGTAQRIFLDESIIKLEHYQNHETNRSGYLKGLAMDCYLHPENDRNSHYFAREMMFTLRYHSAIKEFKRHIAMDRWDQENAQSMLFVGDCYRDMGDFDEALKWYNKCIQKCPDKREPWMRMAEYYYGKNMLKQTVAYCEAALTIKQVPFYSNFQPYYENLPHELLYLSYWWIGEKEKSKEHFYKALSYNPKNKKYISDMKYYRDNKNVIFVKASPTRKEFLDNFMKSMENYNHKYELVISDGSHSAPLEYAQTHDFDEMLILYDSVEIKDLSLFDLVFETYKGKSVSFSDKPYYMMEMGKVKREPYLKSAFPNLKTFKDVCDIECIFGDIYAKNDGENPIVLFPELMEQERNNPKHEIKFGRDNIILENKYLKKYKAHWSMEQVIDCDEDGFVKMPKISILIPTMRKEGLKKCLDSIKNLKYNPRYIQIIMDDGSGTVPYKVSEMLKHAEGEWIVYASDDMEFYSDCLYNAMEDAKKTGKRLIAFNSGNLLPDEGNICEHFAIKRDLINEIGGQIFDTDFHHVGVDNLLWEKCKKLNENFYSKNSIIIHNHFSKGFEMDEVYKKGWSNVEKDQELLKIKLSQL